MNPKSLSSIVRIVISKIGESLLIPHIKTSEIGNYVPRVNRLTVKQRNEKWLLKKIWLDLCVETPGTGVKAV